MRSIGNTRMIIKIADALREPTVTDDRATLSPRIFTIHRTVLYVDPATGELRHGPHATSPPNARLHCEGSQGRIVYTTDGRERPVACSADRSQALQDGVLETATAFEIVSLQQRWIALKAGGLFRSE